MLIDFGEYTKEQVAEILEKMRDRLIDIPGVGVVGHSFRQDELCEACKVRRHMDCSRYTRNGDMCACDCNDIGPPHGG